MYSCTAPGPCAPGLAALGSKPAPMPYHCVCASPAYLLRWGQAVACGPACPAGGLLGCLWVHLSLCRHAMLAVPPSVSRALPHLCARPVAFVALSLHRFFPCSRWPAACSAGAPRFQLLPRTAAVPLAAPLDFLEQLCSFPKKCPASSHVRSLPSSQTVSFESTGGSTEHSTSDACCQTLPPEMVKLRELLLARSLRD